ncbi:MAG TPA: TlpA disulfide reductase family protein [Acidimicrobiales bacterium]|jgi:peroxiredoxin|nr:TlpA disulfide reductase family protein [Acidimicrobiales bacterium]
MTDAPTGGAAGGPPEPPSSLQPPVGPEVAPRKPRKIFLVVGVVLAVVLGIFLFTGLGTSQGTPGSGSAPGVGGPVPSFSRENIGPRGGSTVTVSSAKGPEPTVLLFFGNWCPSCHQELPPLAAAVRAQDKAGGALSHVRVVGVDSLDKVSAAESFIRSKGVTFPVAYDPDATVTSGLFYFTGDPYAVFVKADGTIAKIVPGDVLTPSMLTADERALLMGSATPSGT